MTNYGILSCQNKEVLPMHFKIMFGMYVLKP
jgi:hypothetical protein